MCVRPDIMGGGGGLLFFLEGGVEGGFIVTTVLLTVNASATILLAGEATVDLYNLCSALLTHGWGLFLQW